MCFSLLVLLPNLFQGCVQNNRYSFGEAFAMYLSCWTLDPSHGIYVCMYEERYHTEYRRIWATGLVNGRKLTKFR